MILVLEAVMQAVESGERGNRHVAGGAEAAHGAVWPTIGTECRSPSMYHGAPQERPATVRGAKQASPARSLARTERAKRAPKLVLGTLKNRQHRKPQFSLCAGKEKK